MEKLKEVMFSMGVDKFKAMRKRIIDEGCSMKSYLNRLIEEDSYEYGILIENENIAEDLEEE